MDKEAIQHDITLVLTIPTAAIVAKALRSAQRSYGRGTFGSATCKQIAEEIEREITLAEVPPDPAENTGLTH